MSMRLLPRTLQAGKGAAAFAAALLWANASSAADLFFQTGFEDGEVCSNGCPPDGLQSMVWPTAVSWVACVDVRIYGLVSGDAFLFTTCSPPGLAPGTGDPHVSSVADNLGGIYQVGSDDGTPASSLPHLYGWSCENILGVPTMFCAPPSSAGFALQPGASNLNLTI